MRKIRGLPFYMFALALYFSLTALPSQAGALFGRSKETSPKYQDAYNENGRPAVLDNTPTGEGADCAPQRTGGGIRNWFRKRGQKSDAGRSYSSAIRVQRNLPSDVDAELLARIEASARSRVENKTPTALRGEYGRDHSCAYHVSMALAQADSRFRRVDGVLPLTNMLQTKDFGVEFRVWNVAKDGPPPRGAIAYTQEHAYMPENLKGAGLQAVDWVMGSKRYKKFHASAMERRSHIGIVAGDGRIHQNSGNAGGIMITKNPGDEWTSGEALQYLVPKRSGVVSQGPTIPPNILHLMRDQTRQALAWIPGGRLIQLAFLIYDQVVGSASAESTSEPKELSLKEGAGLLGKVDPDTESRKSSLLGGVTLGNTVYLLSDAGYLVLENGKRVRDGAAFVVWKVKTSQNGNPTSSENLAEDQDVNFGSLGLPEGVANALKQIQLKKAPL